MSTEGERNPASFPACRDSSRGWLRRAPGKLAEMLRFACRREALTFQNIDFKRLNSIMTEIGHSRRVNSHNFFYLGRIVLHRGQTRS
jgi:hypothetical protein